VEECGGARETLLELAQTLLFGALAFAAMPLGAQFLLLTTHGGEMPLLAEQARLHLLPLHPPLLPLLPLPLLLSDSIAVGPLRAHARRLLFAVLLLLLAVGARRAVVEHVIHAQRAVAQRRAVEVVHRQHAAARVPIADEGEAATLAALPIAHQMHILHRPELRTHRQHVALGQLPVQPAQVYVRAGRVGLVPRAPAPHHSRRKLPLVNPLDLLHLVHLLCGSLGELWKEDCGSLSNSRTLELSGLISRALHTGCA
jgi:hypothetical protein